mmetsp:Transcript_56682/g.164390  ORF Transcript_56682/g.164390 Transcript_56682/m.164390 type:complete len:427 (-) Transcript_56682:795-2075(-)
MSGWTVDGFRRWLRCGACKHRRQVPERRGHPRRRSHARGRRGDQQLQLAHAHHWRPRAPDVHGAGASVRDARGSRNPWRRSNARCEGRAAPSVFASMAFNLIPGRRDERAFGDRRMLGRRAADHHGRQVTQSHGYESLRAAETRPGNAARGSWCRWGGPRPGTMLAGDLVLLLVLLACVVDGRHGHMPELVGEGRDLPGGALAGVLLLVLARGRQERHLDVLRDAVPDRVRVPLEGPAVPLQGLYQGADLDASAILTADVAGIHPQLHVQGRVLSPDGVVEARGDGGVRDEVRVIEQAPQESVAAVLQLREHVDMLPGAQVPVGVQVILGLRHVAEAEVAWSTDVGLPRLLVLARLARLVAGLLRRPVPRRGELRRNVAVVASVRALGAFGGRARLWLMLPSVARLVMSSGLSSMLLPFLVQAFVS